MQLVIHTGAHFSEEERLMKCLLRNKDSFSKKGIAVSGPRKYRRLLKQTLDALRTAPAADGDRDVLLDALMDEEDADRLLLSNAFLWRSSCCSSWRDFVPLCSRAYDPSS